MGIKKVGDRVRIFVAIKQLRTRTGPICRAKNMVRLIPFFTMKRLLMSMAEHIGCTREGSIGHEAAGSSLVPVGLAAWRRPWSSFWSLQQWPESK